MNKYGIDVEQMSAHGLAAVRAAERLQARTIIYRDQVPLAVIVPIEDLDRLDPRDPGESGVDPLLSLAGTCNDDGTCTCREGTEKNPETGKCG